MATQFHEAAPRKELSSDGVVKSPLDVVARLALPRDIQSDQGIIFTCAQALGFVNNSDIKLVHSSVYERHSNSAERWPTVMKRVLPVLTNEYKFECEACLSAILFAFSDSRG